MRKLIKRFQIGGTVKTTAKVSFLLDDIVRVISGNGKIRLRLPSHTVDRPREFVLEPKGDNKFFVHMRTWDDIGNYLKELKY